MHTYVYPPHSSSRCNNKNNRRTEEEKIMTNKINCWICWFSFSFVFSGRWFLVRVNNAFLWLHNESTTTTTNHGSWHKDTGNSIRLKLGFAGCFVGFFFFFFCFSCLPCLTYVFRYFCVCKLLLLLLCTNSRFVSHSPEMTNKINKLMKYRRALIHTKQLHNLAFGIFLSFCLLWPESLVLHLCVVGGPCKKKFFLLHIKSVCEPNCSLSRCTFASLYTLCMKMSRNHTFDSFEIENSCSEVFVYISTCVHSSTCTNIRTNTDDTYEHKQKVTNENEIKKNTKNLIQFRMDEVEKLYSCSLYWKGKIKITRCDVDRLKCSTEPS